MLVGQKFGDVEDEVRLRVERASLADLERWTARVLLANTLRDVFDERT